MAVCETVNGDSVQTIACFPASEKSKKRPVPAVNPTQRHGVLANSAQKGQDTKKKKMTVWETWRKGESSQQWEGYSANKTTPCRLQQFCILPSDPGLVSKYCQVLKSAVKAAVDWECLRTQTHARSCWRRMQSTPTHLWQLLVCTAH